MLRTLALTSLRQTRYQQAHVELLECLQIACELGDLAGVAIDLERLGQAAVALGRPERGVVLAAAADRLRQSIGGGLTVESGLWETEHLGLPPAGSSPTSRSTQPGLGDAP